jgi:hypothetical protein
VSAFGSIEAGERSPTFETWDRICKLYGWPQTFVGERAEDAHGAHFVTRAP